MRLFEDFSVKEKQYFLLLLSALLCFWLVFAPVTSAESATPEKQTPVMYQITEQELTTLENNINTLKSINTSLQMESNKQQEQLKALQEQVKLLQEQLAISQAASEKQEQSLTSANKLLEQYAIDAKRERLRIKAQRNAWEVVAACAIIACIAK